MCNTATADWQDSTSKSPHKSQTKQCDSTQFTQAKSAFDISNYLYFTNWRSRGLHILNAPQSNDGTRKLNCTRDIRAIGSVTFKKLHMHETLRHYYAYLVIWPLSGAAIVRLSLQETISSWLVISPNLRNREHNEHAAQGGARLGDAQRKTLI